MSLDTIMRSENVGQLLSETKSELDKHILEFPYMRQGTTAHKKWLSEIENLIHAIDTIMERGVADAKQMQRFSEMRRTLDIMRIQKPRLE